MIKYRTLTPGAMSTFEDTRYSSPDEDSSKNYPMVEKADLCALEMLRHQPSFPVYAPNTRIRKLVGQEDATPLIKKTPLKENSRTSNAVDFRAYSTELDSFDMAA